MTRLQLIEKLGPAAVLWIEVHVRFSLSARDRMNGNLHDDLAAAPERGARARRPCRAAASRREGFRSYDPEQTRKPDIDFNPKTAGRTSFSISWRRSSTAVASDEWTALCDPKGGAYGVVGAA